MPQFHSITPSQLEYMKKRRRLAFFSIDIFFSFFEVDPLLFLNLPQVFVHLIHLKHTEHH